MDRTVATYRVAVVLLTAALLATVTVALTGGDRADAVDGPVETVYIATGRNFPDALAGSTLAVTAGAPMLTVEPRLPLPPATIAALEALDANTIIVFGGPGAIPADVFEALTTYARSGAVTRIAGDDRHDTAARIADVLPDRVADADLLDGLDSSDFVRVQPPPEPVTRYVTCGPREMAEFDRADALVDEIEGRYRVRAFPGGPASVDVGCDLQVPEGATITALGIDLRDENAAAVVQCNSMQVWNRDGPTPELLGSISASLTSTDSPEDARMADGLDDGPVVAGSQTHARLACVMSDVPDVWAYGMFVEYRSAP